MRQNLKDNGLVSGKRREPLTVTDGLLDSLALGALLSHSRSLSLEDLAVVQVAAVVKSLLQNALLPTEEIVAMPAVAGSTFRQCDSRSGRAECFTRRPWNKRMAAQHRLARCSCH
jgi:hypothetical protein